MSKKNGKKSQAKKVVKKVAAKPSNPHRAILALSPGAFVSLFSGTHKYNVTANGIPRDAKIVDIRFNEWDNAGRGVIEVLLEHPAIPELVEGQPVPHVKPPTFETLA